MECFTIICRKCGSSKVDIETEYDYDYDDNLIIIGKHIICLECENTMGI